MLRVEYGDEAPSTSSHLSPLELLVGASDLHVDPAQEPNAAARLPRLAHSLVGRGARKDALVIPGAALFGAPISYRCARCLAGSNQLLCKLLFIALLFLSRFTELPILPIHSDDLFEVACFPAAGERARWFMALCRLARCSQTDIVSTMCSAKAVWALSSRQRTCSFSSKSPSRCSCFTPVSLIGHPAPRGSSRRISCTDAVRLWS